jgi:hypothetical protein
MFYFYLFAIMLNFPGVSNQIFFKEGLDNLKSASFSLYRSIATALVKSAFLHASYGPKNVKLPPFFSSP